MFTITPRTRTREGVSWEDDRCTTGYEIINSDGEIIYDFADEDTKNFYENLNKKEKSRNYPVKNYREKRHWSSSHPELPCGNMDIWREYLPN